jgi:hypothetical protein
MSEQRPGIHVDATELVGALQQKIGQYEVEKTAAEIVMEKQRIQIAELQSQLAPTQTQDS